MRYYEAVFIAGTTNEESFPPETLPEIAFAGRSNVGKSSLINSIIARKNFAHVSSSPGKTKQINFFAIEQKWLLVDLPGYGFASVSKKDRDNWSKLMKTYFAERKTLKFVCLLIDSRHDPMDSDLAMIEWLENTKVNYLVLLTKTDKISPDAIKERKEQLEEFLKFCSYNMEVLPYSIVNGLGRNELIAIVKREAKA